MSVIIGPREFEGPFSGASDLKNAPGIYVLLCCRGDQYELLEVAESENVKASFSENCNKDGDSGSGRISIVAHYTGTLSKCEREGVVQEILQELQFVTGE